MSSIIPKGELTAFQRWEMTSFDEAPKHQPVEQVHQPQISQEEIDSTMEAARLEGYTLGYKEAYAVGQQEGHSDGLIAGEGQIQTRLATLDQLLASLPEQLANADKQIGEDVLELAISLAQAMIKNTLELDREAILPIVAEAIGMLPIVQQPAQLFMHPEDVETIKIHQGGELEKAGWRIISDPNIARGGCKLETAHNLIDATVATRWQRLSEALKPTMAAMVTDETP